MKKQKKQRLDEEQLAGAMKDLGGFNHPIYMVATKLDAHDYRPNPAPPLHSPAHLNGSNPYEDLTFEGTFRASSMLVEAERWVDARAFGCRKLGVPEVEIRREGTREEVGAVSRWQIRQAGYAGSKDDPIRMQARFWEPGKSRTIQRWIDVNDLE